MKLQTIVETVPCSYKISYRDKILFLGSCFASEVGAFMKKLRYSAVVNPFGPLYNPSSLALSLERLEKCTNFTEDDVFMQGDICKSLFISSEFAAPSKEEFLRVNNERVALASEHFRNSSWVVLTFGTRWIYSLKGSGEVVANCHKLSPECFVRTKLTIEQIFDLFAPFIESFRDKKWLFTVSPVRHWKDGAHGNQLSKSTLLLAVERLVEKYENAFYFPAYEIMMDQLRDYRFYAGDMIHPSSEAVQYIWERFSETFTDPAEENVIKIVSKLNLMEDHKPLFPFSGDYIKFENELKSLREKVAQELKKVYKNHNL
jgi:hypothetical protein